MGNVHLVLAFVQPLACPPHFCVLCSGFANGHDGDHSGWQIVCNDLLVCDECANRFAPELLEAREAARKGFNREIGEVCLSQPCCD